jgi:hypothetical protein
MSTQMRIACLCVVSLILVATGCTGASKSFTGNKVSSAPVVSIKQGGAEASTWQTFDLVTNYNYKYESDVFEISGVAVLNDHYQMTYDALKDLRIFLFLLDADAHVLKAVPVARSLTSALNEKLAFNVSLNAPPGLTAFSFGYDGEVQSQRGGTSFYNLPLNK